MEPCNEIFHEEFQQSKNLPFQSNAVEYKLFEIMRCASYSKNNIKDIVVLKQTVTERAKASFLQPWLHDLGSNHTLVT